MSARSAVEAGRLAAESLMMDTCQIRAVIGNTTDPATGNVVPEYGPPVYAGRCKLQSQRSFPSSPDAGEHQFTVTPLFLHLPVTAVVDTGQIVDITGSVDPTNVGRQFRVRADDRKSLQTALRVLVEEVVA